VDSESSAGMQEEAADVMRERAVRLFDFLIRFQQQRIAPVRSLDSYAGHGGRVVWLHAVPEHIAVAAAHRVAQPAPDAPLLVLDRVPRTEPPGTPELVRPWVRAESLRDARSEPELRQVLVETRLGGEGETLTSTRRIEDEPGIRSDFAAWLEEWHAWAASEIENEPVREVYRWLFQMSEQAAAAPEELEVVGAVGCLSWRPEGHDEVRRHLLTASIRIDFDDESGRLTVHLTDTAEGLSVELDMLDAAMWPQPDRLNDIRARARDFEEHVLYREAAEPLLRRLVNNLDANGRYDDADEPCENQPDAAVSFAPAIILRRRSNLGLLRIFQEIKRQLEESSDVPEGIKQLIDVVDTLDRNGEGAEGFGLDAASYLPLPANAQQLDIVRRVDSRRHTVVQGPPGTGKTHTIANLLAHLLARGQRILVTAHTDRALRELRDKIPESLEALCVSVVGRDRSDLADLKVAVDTLATRAAEYDPARATAEIEELEAKLEELYKERAKFHSRILQTRQQETVNREHGAAYQGTLAEIARQHRGEADEYGWLSGFVQDLSETPPLSDEEAVEWLTSLRDPDIARDEPEAAKALVELDAIPNPSAFADLVDTERAAALKFEGHSAHQLHAAYAAIVALDPAARANLRDRFRNLAKTADALAAREEPWMSNALRDTHLGKPELWQQRHTEITRLLARCRQVIERLDATTRIEVDAEQPYVLIAQATELKSHLEGGGKLGRILTPRPVKKAAELLARVRVDDEPPTTIDALTTFIDWMDARRQLDAIERLWPANVPIPNEDTLVERWGWNQAEANQLGRVIQLAESLRAEEAQLDELGVPRPDWTDLDGVRAFGLLVEAAEAGDEAERASRPLAGMWDVLSEACRWPDAAPVLAGLKQSLESRNPVAYRAAVDRLEVLLRIRGLVARRDELSQRLASVVPQLVEAVSRSPADETWGQYLARFGAAWGWCRAATWIDREAAANVEDLERQLHGLEARIRQTVGALTAARAWSLAVSRLGLPEQQNLRSYVLAIRKLGKGTGKYATHRRGEARAALKQCRSAVPAWVMPIYRIAEALEVDRNMFDVVVIDEASQAGVEASFLQYLAPRVVVVGDDKQVSPSGVGLDNQQLINLRRQLLFDFDHGHVWENPTASFFDLARIRYGDVITLREHFRCVPEIIGFSNRIAYEPDRVPLIPLRQYGIDRLEPIMPVHVEDGYRLGGAGKAINPPEAEAIVEAILKCSVDPAYDGRSFGVISLTGRMQAERIEQLLLDRMDPKEFRARELRCGDSADFQGSERDVIFLSMVAARAEGERLAPLTAERYVQRFNVAGSRARDQMWVFHSVTLEELTNREDMRYQLLEYCYGLQRAYGLGLQGGVARVPDDVQVEPFESLFEQHVHNSIFERGYTVVPQWEVYGYRIDLVIVGGQSRLAVECDGDRWHGADRYEQDLARQRELERCGWTFFRVRASGYYRNPHAALAPLWELLDAHDIRPVGWTPPIVEVTTATQPVSEPVKSVASAISLPPPPPPRIETIADLDESSIESAVGSVDEDTWLYEVEPVVGEPSVIDAGEAPDEGGSMNEPKATATGPDVRVESPVVAREMGNREEPTWGDLGALEMAGRADSEDEGRSRESEAPPPAAVADQPLDPEAFGGLGFADIPLGVIPAQIAILVHSRGRLPVKDLPSLYGERFGIRVQEAQEKWLVRFAWSAVGRKFASWNDQQTELLPGTQDAQVLDPPGKWTFAEVEVLARELHKAGIEESELFERVIQSVHPGKRAPRLIARVVGSAIYAATHRPEE